MSKADKERLKKEELELKAKEEGMNNFNVTAYLKCKWDCNTLLVYTGC